MTATSFLTTEETAKLLRSSIRTVHELTRTRAIPHRRFGRRCLFVESELRAWLDGAELEVVDLAGGGRCVRPRST
jgi:excisionase family DNA binding protein